MSEQEEKERLGATPQRSPVHVPEAADSASHVAVTPRPWRLSMSGYSIKSNDDDTPIVAHNPHGVSMREKDAPQWIENAEFIVRACNAHDEMLVALKKAYFELNEIKARDGVPWTHQGVESSVMHCYFAEVVDQCRAAIAKAEKGSSDV